MYVTSDFIGCTCFINQKVGMGIIFKNSFKVSKVQPIMSCCLGLRGSEINIKENLVLILLHLKNSECFLNQSWSSKNAYIKHSYINFWLTCSNSPSFAKTFSMIRNDRIPANTHNPIFICPSWSWIPPIK